jgi:hypothetical protein
MSLSDFNEPLKQLSRIVTILWELHVSIELVKSSKEKPVMNGWSESY